MSAENEGVTRWETRQRTAPTAPHRCEARAAQRNQLLKNGEIRGCTLPQVEHGHSEALVSSSLCVKADMAIGKQIAVLNRAATPRTRRDCLQLSASATEIHLDRATTLQRSRERLRRSPQRRTWCVCARVYVCALKYW